jgi:hypothetical protein
MNDTPEVIRQQMEETKSQLSEKLESLENQVSEGVQSVSDAFDIPLQVERHPWIAVGGSFVLGYLASELLNGPTKESKNERATETRMSPSPVQAQNGNGQHAVEAGQENLSKSFLLGEMKGMLTGALMGVVTAMVSRGVPTVLDYIAKNLHSDPNQDPVGGWERPRSPK